MLKKIIFPILFFSIFNVATVMSEPSSDTKIGLTVSHGKLSGRVEAPYEVLKHSEFLKGMFATKMMESERLKDGQDVPLDLTFAPIYEDLQQYKVEDFFAPQDLLDAITSILGSVHRQEDLCVDKFSLEKTLQLLFVGDALLVKELVEASISILSKNIFKIRLVVLLQLMRCDEYGFSEKLSKKIVEQNRSLFFPIYICEAEKTLHGFFDYIRSEKVTDKAYSNKISESWGEHSSVDWQHLVMFEGCHDRDRDMMANMFLDGKMVMASCDGRATIYKLNKLRSDGSDYVATLGDEGDLFRFAEFSRDGKKIVVGLKDRTATVWMEDEDGGWRCIATLADYVNGVHYLAFNNNGNKIVSTSFRNEIVKVWDIESCLNVQLSLSQVLFFVLAKKEPDYFQELRGDWNNFFSDVWLSFVPQMRGNLKSRFYKIDFDCFNKVDPVGIIEGLLKRFGALCSNFYNRAF